MRSPFLLLSFLGLALGATPAAAPAASHSTCHKEVTDQQTLAYHEHHVEVAFGSLSIYKDYVSTNGSHYWHDSHNHSLHANLSDCHVIELFQLELTNMTNDFACLHEAACPVHTTTSHATAHAGGHHAPLGQFIVIYVIFILAVGCICRYIIKRLNLPVQYTVVLLVVGLIYEAIEYRFPRSFGDLGAGGEMLREIDAHMILILFIPALIFESAFSTDYHTILKEKEQAMLLAGPGVAINTLLTGCVMHYFNNYDWTWSFSFMFGSIVSATDPVAVVALLKELGASKRLSTLIEAESLLNDGTAFVLFMLLKAYAASSNFDLVTIIQQFVVLAICGSLWGIAVGMITSRTLGVIFSDFQVEITVTLVACYVGFYLGEVLFKVSGVLAVVFLGLTVSKNRSAITPAIEETMHGFWEMVGFIANTVLFFLTGQIIMFKILQSNFIGPIDVLWLFILYICIHGTRFLTIWIVFPVLESVGYGCTVPDAAVMLYGGLRGAIGLALALIVETEVGFNALQKDQVLFHVSGVVALTLLVNASTVGALVNYLGLNKPPADSRRLLKGATDHILEETKEMIHKLKSDKNFAGANWAKVEELMPNYGKLLHVYDTNEMSETDMRDSGTFDKEHSATDSNGSFDTAESFDHPKHEVAMENVQRDRDKLQSKSSVTDEALRQTASQKLALNDDVNQALDENEESLTDSGLEKAPTFVGRIGSIGDVLSQFKRNEKEEREKRHVERRFIFVMKASYWGQFEKGLIGQEAVRVLVEAADSAIDENDLSTQRKVLKKYFRIPRYLKWMHNSHYGWVKIVSERLLFGNLGFAIEIASAFAYAAEQAHEFAELLLSSGTVEEEHVKDVKDELDEVTSWIQERSHRVQIVYPEVHQAIQTEHATHYLLHQEKHNIEHLYHKGFLEEAEFGRVDAMADHALNQLFRTGYSEFLVSATDDELFLANPLFSELSSEERASIREGSQQQFLMNKDEFVFERRHDAQSIFVITRGAVAVLERTDPGSSIHGGNPNDFMSSYWKEVEIKGRNEMFEIWPVLHESPQIHSFKVTSENCSGFHVAADTLFKVAQNNNLFWERLWRTAAVELVKYFFKDQDLFVTFDLSHLENFMDDQDMEYVDASAEDSLILVNTTCAILLNGSVLHMDAPGEDPIAAPVVLMENDVPYVPFEDCVVIYLDLNQRGAGHVFGDFGAQTMRKMLHINTRNVLQTVHEQHEAENAPHIHPANRGTQSVTPATNALQQLSRVRSRTTVAAGAGVTPPVPVQRGLDVDFSRIPDNIDVQDLDEEAGWEVVKALLDRYDYFDDITRYARQRMREHLSLTTPRASSKAPGAGPTVDDFKDPEKPKVARLQSAGPIAMKKFGRPSTVNVLGAPASRVKRRSAQFAGPPLGNPLMGRGASANAARVDDILAGLPNRGRNFSKQRPTIVISQRYQRQTKNIDRPKSMDFGEENIAAATTTTALSGSGWTLREGAETPLPDLNEVEPKVATAIEMGEKKKTTEEETPPLKNDGSVLDVENILSDLPGNYKD